MYYCIMVFMEFTTLILSAVDPETGFCRIDEEVVSSSGKMLLMDAMLNQLKSGGHKVNTDNVSNNISRGSADWQRLCLIHVSTVVQCCCNCYSVHVYRRLPYRAPVGADI